MPDDVALSTAARELGLGPGALELAAQLGEVRTVRAAPSVLAARTRAARARAARRVPRAELARLRAEEGFPDGLRERLRVVDAKDGARLLGITAPRFARLARGGCFSPVRFYVNRYRTLVWLYLARELCAFAESRPELLSGSLPRGLRVLLAEGVDLRAVHWRGRRVGQLSRQADGPWEAAAARAAVLGEGVLEEAVPDARERARLRALRPELTPFRGRSPAVQEMVEELCTAAAEDEIFWQRLMLAADLESARASDASVGAAAPAVASQAAGRTDRHGPAALAADVDAAADVVAAAVAERDGCPAGKAQASRPVRHAAGEPVPGTGGGHGRSRVAEERARVLARLRAPRQRPAWWRDDRAHDPGHTGIRGFSRPAF